MTKFAAYCSAIAVLVSMAFLWREIRRQWMYIADISSTVRKSVHRDHEVHRDGYESAREMTKNLSALRKETQRTGSNLVVLAGENQRMKQDIDVLKKRLAEVAEKPYWYPKGTSE